MRFKSLNEKGQATILIGMMMTTFLLFFAFVINVGMLVHAKINLQNAADMAAYAGASVQARQLTQISFLNYEMRRHWKRFLYRYYVLGNLAEQPYPRNSGGSGFYEFRATSNSPPYKVPVVCLAFNSGSNACQLQDMPNPITNSLKIMEKANLVNGTLMGQMENIQQLIKGGCDATSKLNQQIILLWLFNFDHDLKSSQGGAAVASTYQAIKQVASGLGLLPRLAMTRQRIKILNDFVNLAPQVIHKSEAQNWVNDPNKVPNYERALQAYLSAFRTLGSHSYNNTESIVLTELLPSSGTEGNLLKLNDIVLDEFDVYSLQLQSQSNSNARQNCIAEPFPFKITKVTVGVEKDPAVLTYYAVKLEAKAKIIFSPWGDLKLTAYSAARPFGSRIGPPGLTQKDFLKQGAFSPIHCGASADCAKKIPNIPMLATETTDQGWLQEAPLFAFFQAMAGNNTAMSNVGSIDLNTIQNGEHSAAAANPWESAKYNIPMDLEDESIPYFEKFFDPDGYAAFWAPVVPPGVTDLGEVAKQFEPVVDNLKNQLGTATGVAAVDLATFKDTIKKQLTEYLQDLKAGQGENGETLHVARISSPVWRMPENGGTFAPGAKFSVADKLPAPDLVLHPIKHKDKIRTSWNGVKDKDFAAQGRVGYSVKYVSFNSISQTSVDGKATPTNTNLGGDPEVRKLQH
ncbi:MAG: hypothetical protein JNL01_00665 [Bdellovibrionales bacterium]|nr:hypothetical protein [Bdellovibrionales bacterium]